MKKIFNTLMLAFVASIAFTSCNDDDVYFEDPTAKQLTILSRETSFDAAPSQGTIVVDTNEPLSVTSSDQTGWISTAVEGNKVIVNVDLNGSIDGRSAMLTIKAGEKQAQVAIIQSGIIVAFDGSANIKVNDVSRTLTYPFKSNVPVEFFTDQDWITPTYEDGVLTISLAANNTRHVRSGVVSYTAGPVSDEITVFQADFTKDLAGDDYILLFVDGDDGKTKYLNVELRKTGTKYTLEIPAFGFSIPLTYTASNIDLRMAAGAYMGDLAAYKVHTVMWDTTQGYITWNTAVSMSVDWRYEEEDGEGVTYGEFVDNGSWTGYAPDAFILEAFSGTPATSSGRLGDLMSLVYPTLVKFHDITAANSASAAVAKSYAANPKARKLAQIESAVPYEFTGIKDCKSLAVDE
ncbi:MAG: BACON domain-containing protein [Duncaniella sp.]|nr:BACON domain-containing protein [Duncaniella sp.]MDE6860680.1 BACON domain-containing protein [Duncaniella sp.]